MSERKNELFMALCKAIAKDEQLQGVDFEYLSVVIGVGDGFVDNSGYVYYEDGTVDMYCVSSEGFNDLIYDFRKETLVDSPSDEGWHQCLIQIKKANGKIRMFFEYENPDRWNPVIGEEETLIEEIRPNFGE